MSRSVGRIKRGPMAADVLGMHFTQVFNKAARDKRLSRRARGLLLELLSHQDGFGVSVEGLVAQGPEGRDAIRSAIAELEKYGYLHRERERDAETGQLGDSVYSVTDMPEGLTLDAPAPWGGQEPEDPEVPAETPADEPRSSDPASENPTLDFPTEAKPPHKNTNLKNNNTTEEPAPTARSAADVRRTTDGSCAREAGSGSAATEETSPVVAEDLEDSRPAGEAPAVGSSLKVPGPRAAGSRKPSPFPAELRQRIYRTEALLPEVLRAALLVKLPHGHLPNTTRQVTAQALETRTPEELGERAARRWISYGYERDHYDGVLRSPLGVVEELLRPTPYCPLPDCEDGRDRHTGIQCMTCAERIEARKQARKAGKTVPTARPTRLYRDREECDVCSRPLKQGATPGDVCRPCQAEMDRGNAHVLNGPPAPAAAPEIAERPVDASREAPGSADTPETPETPEDAEQAAEQRREREEMDALRARIAAENPGLAEIARKANH